MTVTHMANLAVKVTDLDTAIDFYRGLGAEVTGPEAFAGSSKADVWLGGVQITLFTRAIYEDTVPVDGDGFLHTAWFCDDLDTELAGHRVLWGPEVVSGSFGTRRIAFIAAPGGVRLELMEQLGEPT